jgi:hypothetical protein
MCYASDKDFGWGFRKEAVRTPETRQGDQGAGGETWTKTDDSEVKAFLDKSAVEEPTSDRAT